MAVRNCAELGENLQLIMQRLIANDKLVKLLYYTDQDPLSHEALTDAQKRTEIFEKLIKIVPFLTECPDNKSIVSIRVETGVSTADNDEFANITIAVEVFVPWTAWIIKDSNLRPFAIMGAIQESLNNKKINGLGLMNGGDFGYKFGTQEFSCYTAIYSLTQYA